jgi:hypothetical protein
MFISKMALPRRTFLRGLGVTLALPLLDAMVPAATALAESPASPVRRIGFVFVPHGANQDWAPVGQRWKPPTAGENFEFSTILKPLETVRNHVTVISNFSRGTQSGHANSPTGWLAGLNQVKRTDGADYVAGTTFDQMLARQIGKDTALPSLELATEDFTGYIGSCDVGYNCAYYNTISWSSPSTPLPMDIDPRAVFERLFGRPGTSAQRVERLQQDKSILDSIKEDAADLERGLGAQDRNRLGQYLNDVREIERRLQQIEAQNRTKVTLVDAPIGIPESFEEHAGLMYDLLTVAYQADMTRIATFMLCRELSQRTYADLGGLSEPHHSMSHHQNDPEKLATLAKIQTYHISLFAKFVEKLNRTPDGDGSLLDHTLMAYGSGMANSNGHTPDPVPLVLVGGAAGALKGNRHIEAEPHTPLANLWVTVADKYGVAVDKIGNSTGRFDI